MSELRFVGDMRLAYGAALAVAAAALAVWIYRRQFRQESRRWLPILLITLRATAVAMVVLLLAGPVWQHREVIPQNGRVIVLVDESQSMQVQDRQASIAEKALAAKSLGWWATSDFDTSASEAAGLLRDAIATIDGLSARNDERSIPQTCKKVAKDLEKAAAKLDTFQSRHPSLQSVGVSSEFVSQAADSSEKAALAVRPQEAMQKAISYFYGSILRRARSLQQLCEDDTEPAERLRQRLEELRPMMSGMQAQLDASYDAWMATETTLSQEPAKAALHKYDETNRWQRAAAILSDPQHGLLSQLARVHDVRLIGLDGDICRVRWESGQPTGVAPSMAAPAAAASTNLNFELDRLIGNAAAVDDHADGSGDALPRAAVVLLSDGRHNSGRSPLETARQLAARGVPLHAVVLGSERVPADLAMVSVEVPNSAFREDQIHGRLVLADHMPPGKPFTVQITADGRPLWQQVLKTAGAGLRSVEFTLSIREAVDRLLAGKSEAVHVNSLPLSLQARVLPVAGELRGDNNTTTTSLRALTRRYRLLLVDGRPRWELRYVRNLFERDQRWQVTAVMPTAKADQAGLPRGNGAEEFPPDRDALFDYDVIMLGDIPAERFRAEELQWLKEFVEQRGGGLVLLDGSRGGLRSIAASSAGDLVPVKWLNPGSSSESQSLQWRLTQAGRRMPALMLSAKDEDNDELWSQLPAAHQSTSVEALPGSEPLVQLVASAVQRPAVVLQRFGAGRVLYCASDETWRWRREVADLYHQRYWMQMTQWMMEEPFAASDAYLSLDVGSAAYPPGDSAQIRVRLRDESGRPVRQVQAQALLYRDGKLANTVLLEADTDGSGVFRGRSGPLSPGKYEVAVRAAGFADDHFRARTEFRVEPATTTELAELNCNHNLLSEMCKLTGGQALREYEAARVVDLLRPLTTQRVRESETRLWQSYWWFMPIVLLLGSEWWIRKRKGYL